MISCARIEGHLRKITWMFAAVCISCSAAAALWAGNAEPTAMRSGAQMQSAQTAARGAAALAQPLRQFVKVDAPIVVLEHVTVIDGTGAAAQTDQTIIIRDAQIAAVGP